jgi:ribose/xylose/arabinose/galactoside ABC-type transport system permease subunit
MSNLVVNTKVKAETKKGRLNFFVKWFLLGVTIVVAAVFGMAESKFFQIPNMMEILRASVTLSVLATALVFVFAVGEIDFATGTEMSLGGVIIGKLMDLAAFQDIYVVAVILTIVLLGFIGFINGVLVVRVGMPAFIATLGMSTMLSGLCKWFTGGGYFVSTNWPESFSVLGQKYTFGVIPNPIFTLLFVAIIAYLILGKTRYGRYFYAVGANSVAAAHVGINVKRTKIVAFIFTASICSIAGIVSASTINQVSATVGADSMLGAISAMMLGATFLKPGVFNVPGAVLGGVLLAVIANGLIMVNASFWLKDIVQASILLLSVGFISFLGKGLKVKTL